MQGSKATAKQALLKVLLPEFPETPEGILFYEIISRAIRDLNHRDHHVTATRYLSGQIPHASSLGISSGWIRRKIKQYLAIDLGRYTK
jgi:hypothetical protein